MSVPFAPHEPCLGTVSSVAWYFAPEKKDVIFLDSDPPEAAGHSNWYMFSQTDDIFQESDPPEAAGHHSA